MAKTWQEFGITPPDRFNEHGEGYTECPKCSSQRKGVNKKAKVLGVNRDKEIWGCNHCGWTGSLKRGDDTRQHEAHALKAEDYNRPNYNGHTPLSQWAIEFFQSRGISLEAVRRNRITTSKVWMPNLGDTVEAIRFPFYRDGICINIKSRSANKDFRQEVRTERILFGLDDINIEETIIVEGEMDKLAIETAGLSNCVSVPDGAPAPNTSQYGAKFKFLENCQDRLELIKRFILALDNDAPGKRLQEELIHRLGRDKCAIVTWPDDCKDANDVLIKHGPTELLTRISDAEVPPIEGILRLSDIKDEMQLFYEEGMQPGFELSWGNLKDLYRVSPGRWTVVTGIPGHGKSEFLDSVLMDLAKLYNWRFAMYSPENQPIKRHAMKLMQKYIQKPGLKTMIGGMTQADFERGFSWTNHHFQWFKIPENQLSIDAILDITRQAIFRDGIKGIVIDPWNELEHHRPQYLSEGEYINKILTKIRNFALNTQIHIWIVAHPTKIQKDLKTGKYNVPRMYDIAGSANWANQADNGLTVYRNFEANNPTTEVHVQKIRFAGMDGRIGKACFTYDTITGNYQETPCPI